MMKAALSAVSKFTHFFKGADTDDESMARRITGGSGVGEAGFVIMT